MNFVKPIVAIALALLAATAFAAVDINKDSLAELESIKGIGPSMSVRIIDARKSGAFKDWIDLQSRVKGIGAGNSAKFSADGLTVNGAAFSAPAVSGTPTASAKAPKTAKAGQTERTK